MLLFPSEFNYNCLDDPTGGVWSHFIICFFPLVLLLCSLFIICLFIIHLFSFPLELLDLTAVCLLL